MEFVIYTYEKYEYYFSKLISRDSLVKMIKFDEQYELSILTMSKFISM